MDFRFRIGPFTFGRSGIRLSIWNRLFGFSTPLTGKGKPFGKIKLGPVSWFSPKSQTPISGQVSEGQEQLVHESCELVAIKAFRSDAEFLEKIRRNGVPWRGVQERIKEFLLEILSDRDNMAYRLVPKASDVVFGAQNTAWKTEKRASKSGTGYTTWIVLIESGA